MSSIGLQIYPSAADKEGVIDAPYSWRPLGALLVEKGLLTSAELDGALAEQRRSGRLVGEILVESGYLSAFSVAQALTEQHGVELQVSGSSDAFTATEERPPRVSKTTWRPLGKLLVETGFLTKDELEQALAEQRWSGGRRLLGEILVAEGLLSGLDLARTLAEQHGLELSLTGGEEVTTVLRTPAPGQAVYEVREVVYAPRYEAEHVLYTSVSFLEAADFAAEFVEDNNPEGVEIQRTSGRARETVWTYSESRAAANASSHKPLAETFGFDPTLWGAA
jgi:hypothetical protein